MKNKKTQKSSVVILVLALTLIAVISNVSFVQAENITTYANMSTVPNPVGVNQPFEVSFWVLPLPPTDADVFHGFEVTITKPDGTLEKRGPLTSSPVGAQYFVYTPDQIGTYYLQFAYPGETFASLGNTYLPCQTEKQAVVVQQQAIPAWQDTPLPTDYWTRPINAQNRLWTSIAGNWLQRSYNGINVYWDSASGFNPYSAAPRSPHVVWTKELAMGGLVGGERGSTSYYSGLSYEPKFTPPIIMNGRLYYNIYATNDIAQPDMGLRGFICVDLRTGEELWRRTEGNIDVGQLYNYVSGNQMGVLPYLWSLTGDTWKMYDANTGEIILEFANASGVLFTMYGTVWQDADGVLYVNTINPQSKWLAMWNSTKAFEANGLMPVYASGVGFWRPIVGTYDWLKGIQWNVTLPDVGGDLYNVGMTGDILVASTVSYYYTSTSYVDVGFNLRTGQQLWIQNRNKWEPYQAFGEGIYVSWNSKTRTYTAYDGNTGLEKWVSEPLEYPWGSFTSDNVALIADGKVYALGYDGYLHAFDVNTGKHLWKFYSGNSGTETPYGSYPFYYGPIIADGVLFAGTGEHSPTQPYIRGERLFAVDVETGKELWSINGMMLVQAITDGYLLAYNAYDNRIYCFGKGPSATTVTAPDIGVPKGSSVIIKGTVTDQSSGQPGTPAIADVNMGEYMANIKEQQPIDLTLVTGVPVKLSAQAPDGSTMPIADVTSDAFGNFFYDWTPPDTGMYKIVATFAGSASYGSSSAETAIGVTAAASTTETTTTSAPLDLYIIVATIVIIIAIAIVGMMILRKRS